MSSRYHRQATSATLANGASVNFAFSQENVPFEGVACWIQCPANLSWAIYYTGPLAGSTATTDTGSYVGGSGPVPVWIQAGILPQDFSPVITFTNNTANPVTWNAVWVGKCDQPNG